MKRLLNSTTCFVLALIYTLCLLTVSLIKIKSDNLPVKFEHADKIFHFGAYFGMALLWHLYYFQREKVRKYKPNYKICLLIVGFGIVIEVLQRDLTTYRGFEFLDIVANTSGVILAFILLKILSPKLKALIA